MIAEHVGILIASGAGLFTTVVSSVITWALSKKKYYSEVDSTNIKNMQDSLEFYTSLVDDCKQRLAEEIKDHKTEVEELKRENSELKREIKEQDLKFEAKFTAQQKEITLMKNQMLSVYSQVCLNLHCAERKVSKSTATNKPTPKKHNDKKVEKVENHKK